MRIVKQIFTLLTIVYAYISSGYAQTNSGCGPEKFRCHNGECIEGELLCDGKANCKDSSDETQEECTKPEILCPDYAFRCKYGACINGDGVCNHIQDCVDNSDETQPQCARINENNNQTARPVLQCKVNQFTCNNGQCIDSVDVCDGIKNCEDGSDEISARCESLTCAPTVFRCAYGACIDGDLRCNGIFNCADGSDEDPRLCSGNGWLPPLPSVDGTKEPQTNYNRTTTEKTSGPFVTKTCKAPPQPQNGRWKLYRYQCSNTNQDCDIEEGVDLGLGSHLIYSCNSGYKIKGSTDVSCSFEGKWLNIPSCIEIRCKALSTAAIKADCSYNDNWVSCDSPVLPKTTAKLSCRNSYQRVNSYLLSRQRDFVSCNSNGQWEPEPIQCDPVCGLPPSRLVIPNISNGRPANITEFPWHASMYIGERDKPKQYICGASIIKEKLLITAAHCVFDEITKQVTDPNKIYIATGNLFRDYESPSNNPSNNPYVKKNQVKHIYTCNYLGLNGNYINDIAILELIEPFVLSATLVPICIDLYSDRSVSEGALGKVAGFGITQYNEISAILQALTVPYIPYNKCKSAGQSVDSQQYITDDKFCAGYTNGSSVCQGDSGGGLVFKTDNLWYLRGIVSVSFRAKNESGCNSNLYSLYTQISSHINWIQNVIASLEYNRPLHHCTTKT